MNKGKLKSNIISAVIAVIVIAGTGTFVLASNMAKRNELEKKNNETQTETVVEETTTFEAVEETKEQETQAETKNEATKEDNTGNNQVEDNNSISLEQAKKIALSEAGLSQSEVVFTKERTGKEDGQACYEIEFNNGKYEYEYDISMDGNIISYDRDKMDRKQVSNEATAKYIGVDEAKSIALKDAGVSSGSAKFEKAKLEKDDDEYVYEIEFKVNDVEYDYEIDARSGKVLSKSAEDDSEDMDDYNDYDDDDDEQDDD